MIVDPDFFDHWKTRLLVASLDGDEAAPLYVLRLWAHCQNRRKDTFDNLAPAALKALCHWPGEANKLDSSLVTSGFIRRESSILIVVGWSEYNAQLIAAWENGKLGGRKRRPRTRGQPTGIPRGSPGGTQSLLSTLLSSPQYLILNSEEFKKTLGDWLSYKAERRESYKDQGLKQLISAAAKRAEQHGIQAVIEAMQTAMSNTWQGWDFFKGKSHGHDKPKTRGVYRPESR